MRNQAFNADCFDVFPLIPDGSIDMILCDLPYGTTACKWDTILPFDKLWQAYERIIKPNGAIVLTASQPFTSALVMSNKKLFKYTWVWEKSNTSNPLNAPYQPLKVHEDIVVFSQSASTYSIKGSMKYSPQKIKGVYYKGGTRKGGKMEFHTDPSGYIYNGSDDRYPRSVLKINEEKGLHPTQKPVALMEYLIKTYTNEGDLVLDNCAGSFTTAIAAINTNRNYICIEKELDYYNKGIKRIESHLKSINNG